MKKNSNQGVIFLEVLDYLEVLKNRYRRYFNIYEKEHELLSDEFDLMATCNIRGEKYMFSKSIKVYTVEENEHCFVKVYGNIVTDEQIQEFADSIKKTIEAIVKPHPDHLKTILTGVVIAEQGCTDYVKKFVTNYRYQRSFMFCLKGWCEVRLVLVDLSQNTVSHHAKNEKLKMLYNIPQLSIAQ